jgi:hypothetical protein
VERTIGLYKRRFGVLHKTLENEWSTNCDLLYSLCVLHNFLLENDPDSTAALLEEVFQFDHIIVQKVFKFKFNFISFPANYGP